MLLQRRSNALENVAYVSVRATVCCSQELLSRTSLETQKLDLIDEVSFLKLKLVSMEETHSSSQPQEPADTDQKKAEVRTGSCTHSYFSIIRSDQKLCLCSSPVAGFSVASGLCIYLFKSKQKRNHSNAAAC